MKVRHLTAADNVSDDGSLIDPLAVRHGLIVAGRVEALAGLVDPLTHLNSDFTEHGLEQCAVVERLEVGARACFEEDGLRLAWAADADYRPLGRVNLSERLREWRAARASVPTGAAPAPHSGAAELLLQAGSPPLPRAGEGVEGDEVGLRGSP